jgi:hypothetical protein
MAKEIKKTNRIPVQLGNTSGWKLSLKDTPSGFLYVDDGGSMCTIPWEDAIRRFGPPKNQA